MDNVGQQFFATYGDGLGNVDLGALLEFHNKSGGVATVTAVPLRSQYGTLHFDDAGIVDRFTEKPVIRDSWINAGFFVFDRKAAAHWEGHSLESEVLPGLAAGGELYTYLHHGFWKSMDTSKDQQEMERLAESGEAPWNELGTEITHSALDDCRDDAREQAREGSFDALTDVENFILVERLGLNAGSHVCDA